MSEPEETYSLLPVNHCEIHPLAKIRFDYGVEELAESIRAIGQVQPGRAVEQDSQIGRRYLVYIGCRRLVACKKASVKHFKAIVVTTKIEESRLQRELFTENTRRADLSVLEELNLLANYSKANYSLDVLARDVGLSPKLVRSRVMLATKLQDKTMLQTLYKMERLSGFTFTHRHIEKIMAMEEAKWVPLAAHAANLHWNTEDVESIGRQFTAETLIERLPEWGRELVRGSDQSRPLTTEVLSTPQTSNGPRQYRVPVPTTEPHSKEEHENLQAESLSRYQTASGSAQFLICPKCGSESVVEIPRYPSATLLMPGKTNAEGSTIALGKESILFQIGAVIVPCKGESCGAKLTVVIDQSGDGSALSNIKRLVSMIGQAVEPEDGGMGALIWDGKEGSWLKFQSKGEGCTYRGYDEQAKRWVVPVAVGRRAAR